MLYCIFRFAQMISSCLFVVKMFLTSNVYASRGATQWASWLLGCASTLHLSLCFNLSEFRSDFLFNKLKLEEELQLNN